MSPSYLLSFFPTLDAASYSWQYHPSPIPPDMMIISIAAIFCIIGFLTSLLLCQKEFKQYIQNVIVALRLPGPPVYPFIGNSYLIFSGAYEYAARAIEEKGTIQRIWASIFPLVLLGDPRHLKKIFLSSKHLEKSHGNLTESFLGKGLVSINAAQWQRRRKLIQPSFGTSKLGRYAPIMVKGASSFLKAIKQTIQSKNNNELNITKLVNASISEISTGIFLGLPKDKLPPNTADNSHSRLILAIDMLNSFLIPLPAFFKKFSATLRTADNQLDGTRDWMEKLVAERRANQKASPSKDNCILDQLLRLNFTEEECLDEIHSFMLVSQDTVAISTAITLHLLAKHQDIQAKAYAEAESILGEQQGTGTSQGINDLQYIEYCVKETLRLFPVVSFFGRTLGEEIDLDGTKLPAGCKVMIVPFATHRMPEYFPNPEVFDPERFNLKNSLNRPTCAFMAFSQGSRNCIGNNLALMEIKVMVASTLLKYHLSLPAGKENLNFKFQIASRVSGGVWIKFTERKLIEKQ